MKFLRMIADTFMNMAMTFLMIVMSPWDGEF